MAPWRCWKSVCTEPPPFLAVSREWESALFSCASHLGRLTRLGFVVHNVDDLLARPARLPHSEAILQHAAQRHRDTA